jgi:hypothetical protein
MQQNLEDLVKVIRLIDNRNIGEMSSTKGKLSLKVSEESGSKQLLVEGDEAGLVHLARLIVDVAAKKFPGAHAHIDEFNVDECEMALTFVKAI